MLVISGVVSGHAEGLRAPAQGAYGLARHGGRIAQIRDATATTHNPANLVDLEQAEVIVAPTVIYIEAQLTLPSGDKAQTENPWKILPNLYAATPLDEQTSVGLGITTPYGGSYQWEDSGAFAASGALRYAAPHFGELKTINLNPSIAHRLNENIQVGVGMDIMWSEMTIKQHYPWATHGAPLGLALSEGRLKMEGDGVGYGANFGVTWKINEHHRLAATYRTAIRTENEGSFRVSNFPTAVAAITAPGATQTSDFNSALKFPSIFGLGYGVQVNDALQVEANLEILRYSNFRSLDFNVGNNAVLFGGATQIPQNWNNTFTAGFAVDYALNNHWNLRGGYQFFESPVPSSTISTILPDSHQTALTTGVAYRQGSHSIGLGYGLLFYSDRIVSNNQNAAFNGTYEVSTHLLSLSYGLAF